MSDERQALIARCPTCKGVVSISTTEPDAAAETLREVHEYGLTLETVPVSVVRAGIEWCGCDWSEPEPEKDTTGDLFAEATL